MDFETQKVEKVLKSPNFIKLSRDYGNSNVRVISNKIQVFAKSKFFEFL